MSKKAVRTSLVTFLFPTGKQTALELARRGASVVLACRNRTRGETAVSDIIEETGNPNVRFRELDLSSLASVRRFASALMGEETSLYALVNNAGVFWVPHRFTEEGFELNFGNYLVVVHMVFEKLDPPKMRGLYSKI